MKNTARIPTATMVHTLWIEAGIKSERNSLWRKMGMVTSSTGASAEPD